MQSDGESVFAVAVSFPKQSVLVMLDEMKIIQIITLS